MRFPLFNTADTTTLLKNQLDLSVSRNGCPANCAPLYQWSWLRNARRPGWKRPLARLPPLPVTAGKKDPVNIRRCSPSVLDADLKSESHRPERPEILPKNALYQETKVEITPDGSSSNVKGGEAEEREVESGMPEVKRKQLVVVIPYIQYDSDIDESEENVDEDSDTLNQNNINHKHEKQGLKCECHQKKEIDKRPFQEKENHPAQTVCNKQSEIPRSPLKSGSETEIQKSALRMRALIRKMIASTAESRIKRSCSRTEGHSPDDEEDTKNKSIIDFSHKVRVQWKKELREILNKSPDCERARGSARVNDKTNSESCKMAAILSPRTSSDNFFSFQIKYSKTVGALSKPVKQSEPASQRPGVGYNPTFTSQISQGQKTDKFVRRKPNLTAPLDVCRKKRTRKLRDLYGRRDNSPDDSFDFHYFWNLLEASKRQAGAGIKHDPPNGSLKNSYNPSSEFWVINSPVYKNTFVYKKKLI